MGDNFEAAGGELRYFYCHLAIMEVKAARDVQTPAVHPLVGAYPTAEHGRCDLVAPAHPSPRDRSWSFLLEIVAGLCQVAGSQP